MREARPAATHGTPLRWGAAPLTGAVLGLALLSGCPDSRKPGPPPRTVEEAVERVNTNLSKIDAPLYCKDARVSFTFRDSKGKERSFLGHPATIIFQPPRDLYFDIKASLSLESVARVGSNNDLYWFYVDVGDTRKLWFGEWAALDGEPSQRLPIPPNDLLDALMFRPLPRALTGGLAPVLRLGEREQWLIYVRVNAARETVGYREVRLDPFPPQQPAEIIDRDRHGRVLMHAWLSDYRPVDVEGQESRPWTARKYRVEWPQTGTSMSLAVDNAKFRLDQPPFADFPDDWTGEVENLDEAPLDPGISQAPAARPGPRT